MLPFRTQINLTAPLQKRSEHAVLEIFWRQIEALPPDIPEGDDTCELVKFTGEPFVETGEDAWEVWDRQLNNLLQNRTEEEMNQLVRRGKKGLHGFYHFLDTLVTKHNVQVAVLEPKIGRIQAAIQRM